MEPGYFRQLRADHREILTYAKSLGSHEARNAEKKALFDQLAASGNILLTPRQGESAQNLYMVDGGGTAHIRIVGQLTPVADEDPCGGYTAQALTEYGFIVAATDAANADDRVESIDYHISSPGGYVSGVESAAQAIALSSKPTRAIVGDMAASAAYWLASQAGEVIASSPLSRVGSIGVIVEGYNDDRAMAEAGLDHVVIVSSGAPNKYADTATEEGRAMIKAEIDKIEGVFVDRVAQGRGRTAAEVRENFGQGGVLIAADALKAGMIDAVLNKRIVQREQTNAENKKADVVVPAVKPAKTENKGGSKIMTLDQLKAESPEVYAQALNDGIKAERDRVAAINAFAPNGPAAAKVAAEAITAGKSFAEAMPELVAASSRGPGAQENAPSVATSTAGPEGLTDEDAQAAEMFGMSFADYNKYKEVK